MQAGPPPTAPSARILSGPHETGRVPHLRGEEQHEVSANSEASEDRDCRKGIGTGAGLPLTPRGATCQRTVRLEGLVFWGQPACMCHLVICPSGA